MIRVSTNAMTRFTSPLRMPLSALMLSNTSIETRFTNASGASSWASAARGGSIHTLKNKTQQRKRVLSTAIAILHMHSRLGLNIRRRVFIGRVAIVLQISLALQIHIPNK